MRWVEATGSRIGVIASNWWTPQHGALHAIAYLAAGIDEHAGADTIGWADLTRCIGDTDRCHQAARSNDFAHDDGPIQIAAWRGQQHGIAGGEMALIEPVPEPVRGGGADLPADGERAPAMARAVEIGTGDQRRSHGRGEI